LALAGRSDLVVVTLDADTDLAQDRRDGVSYVYKRIERSDRDITLLGPDVVAGVGAELVTLAARVPVALVRVHVIPGRVLLGMKMGLVKDKELGLGADVDRIGYARKP